MPIMPLSESSLGSPLPLVTISNSDDSDNEYISSYHNMSAQTTTLLKRNTTATYIGEQGKPPIITPGKLTPELLFDFENGAYSYFSFKDMKTKMEVPKVTGSLQDGRIQTWYRLNRVAVDAAGFPAFMKHICNAWLEPGWEQDVKLAILMSHQNNTPISDWIMLLESTNALLKGHVRKLSDDDLRNHIQSHVHANTMTAATTAELHLIVEYEKYKCALKVVDDARIRADELLRAVVKQMMVQPSSAHPQFPRSNMTSLSSTTVVNTSSSTHTLDRLPALTSAERALLVEHNGCFKCRCFYTMHKSPNCPDGFPDKTLYTPLTDLDALAAKKHQIKKEKIPVAAVVPTVVVMPSAVLGEGSDSEYVIAPFYVPHFYYDCSIGGSTASSQLPIHALIDHGLDSVLINPLLADQLQLRRHKLPSPKEVIMAIGDGHRTFSFDEWVPVMIISMDQSWTSRTCHAIIAPNLSVPLLLGGPFLFSNSLVIDHQLHTCIDKKTGYDLLNLPTIKQNITKPKLNYAGNRRLS
ncbi:hypothetical protein PILCRDRAFT_9497 [Piloderma croceum F 1598]|uniref:Uncharacterized protein n=1 Tax=Piloderma croceum (strain F 1598) TaxID=765440 RepID=A0A0C3FLW2_PILCF|nr:hypothetical protein PILCRDRAFT_9497 [Piloderma croceum F 1598]